MEKKSNNFAGDSSRTGDQEATAFDLEKQRLLDELEAAFLAAPGPDDEPAPTPVAEPVAAATPAPSPAQPAVHVDGEVSVATQSIRVSVQALEDLMTMVSELVLTRNQLLQMVRGRGDSEFAGPLQRLSQCTSELQEGVMKTRMQPIGNAWSKLPRIIRDLSIELGKKIDLDMRGAETELDRQVLELIKDPLTHMVRNSADHGIEGPAERTATGKPETGTIMLNAFHEGGQIIIEITDDGRGLDTDKIKAKALQNGIATEEELSGLSDAQIYKFIFHPGFSTAEKVTSVSGRGVGMDVVRSNIEKIGGTVDLSSVPGKGSKFSIKIPLTLAIVSALITQSGGERFAMPQINVIELVCVSGNSEHKIERIHDTSVLRLRDQLLPLVYLNSFLSGGQDCNPETTSHDNEKNAFIIVTQVGAFVFGIVVDKVFDAEEIVIKPVAPLLREMKNYSGNTILGDGSVVMILDPNGIAATVSGQQGTASDNSSDQEIVVHSDRDAMLVLRAAGENPKAVPLALVARLEDFDVARIEQSNGQMVIQYRGQMMPLTRISDDQQPKAEGRQPVLVFADGDWMMGLIVDEIVDIVEETLDIELGSSTPGLIGSAVLAGHATDIIDVEYFVAKVLGSFGGRGKSDQDGRHLLLVDDSAFFCNMLKPMLVAAGYQVTPVTSAETAMLLLDGGKKFDVIISDIDMPDMNGFQFAQQLKSQPHLQDTPLIALSGKVDPQYLAQGREAGFAEYVAKSDREGLLASLSRQLTLQKGAA